MFTYMCMIILVRNFTRVATMMHYFITVRQSVVLFCHREAEVCIILSPLNKMMHYFITMNKNDVLFYYYQG
jgi:hypothetical protein